VPIEGLPPTSALLAALRAEVAKKTEREPGARPDVADASLADHVVEAKKRDVAGLKRELAAMVKGISPDDEKAMAAVRPRVVRTVLLWEFGARLREYSEWQPMLERLVATLEADERHRAQFAGMIRELQG
jgi:hypothetical protein